MWAEDKSVAFVNEPLDEEKAVSVPIEMVAPPSDFVKAVYGPFPRKRSLLTEALHSPDESHDEDNDQYLRGWHGYAQPSGHSAASISTADLTSDDGQPSPDLHGSLPSPAFPPSRLASISSMAENMLLHAVPTATVSHHTESAVSVPVEQGLEAGLGRKRCIKFSCQNSSQRANEILSSKDHLPYESGNGSKMSTNKCFPPNFIGLVEPASGQSNRRQSSDWQLGEYPSPGRATSQVLPSTPLRALRIHRDSDSTIRNVSPKQSRKTPPSLTPLPDNKKLEIGVSSTTRFHEFAESEEEIDDWVQEATCHKSRLTVDDTLTLEKNLRKLAEEAEAEEEALEDDDDDEDEDDDEVLNEESDRSVNGSEEDDDVEALEEDEERRENVEQNETHPTAEARGTAPLSPAEASDTGFHSDNEDGFANSTDDDDDDAKSDFEWWAPTRPADAATLDRTDHIRPINRRRISDSSIDSVDDSQPTQNALGPKRRSPNLRKQIKRTLKRPSTSSTLTDLPDSTDFAAGTLDEDRAVEEAYFSSIEQRRHARHKTVPQDIDPTFPTSDPDMTEAEELAAAKAFSCKRPATFKEKDRKSDRLSEIQVSKLFAGRVHTSPPPMAPVPAARARSPRRNGRLRSPPPQRNDFRARAPKVFSLYATDTEVVPGQCSIHTKSLPRDSPIRQGRINHIRLDSLVDDDDDDNVSKKNGLHRRGAIDIVKGLEKKRQRRKEKLYEKYCRKNEKGKDMRPKPGMGVERMRELARESASKGRHYHAFTAEGSHIISC